MGILAVYYKAMCALCGVDKWTINKNLRTVLIYYSYVSSHRRA